MDSVDSEAARMADKAQERTATDAHSGTSRNRAGVGHSGAASTPQGVSLSAAWRGYRETKPRLEHGHHAHQVGARFCVPNCDHRLVFAPRADLAYQQQHGCIDLCKLPGGGVD